jgi:hypothetical protein
MIPGLNLIDIDSHRHLRPKSDRVWHARPHPSVETWLEPVDSYLSVSVRASVIPCDIDGGLVKCHFL